MSFVEFKTYPDLLKPSDPAEQPGIFRGRQPFLGFFLKKLSKLKKLHPIFEKILFLVHLSQSI
jgi:hypothetical protein